MRKKKALANIFFSILLEIVTVLSGLIVPRLIIGTFGSATNGLINSISSFVGYISLLQSGVGSVVKASLYKPLAKNDHNQLCVVLKTSEEFFRKIAFFSVIYIGILSFVFPVFITREYDTLFTISLVVIVGISLSAQYFFGITYQMLLEADQKSYIYSLIQIFAVIVNTIVVVILINFKCSIQLVKLGSTVVFVIRPIVVGMYGKKKYCISHNVKSDNKLIRQRWDGFLQAIAFFIHSKTDIFVLTIFASLTDVSVYSVYAMVTAGLSSVINSIDKAVRSAFGNIIASEEHELLQSSFAAYTCLMHIFSTICFGTASVTVISFVKVYVKNINDTNYIQPIFAVLIITAELFYCLRMPYNSIIYAAGKFKETKYPAIIEAIINIVVSCLLVNVFGIVGVAIGTLVAMIYRTISFVLYLSKNILVFGIWNQIKRFGVTLIAYLSSIYALCHISVDISGYGEWAVYAAFIMLLMTITTFGINFLLDFSNTKKAIYTFVGRKKKKEIK